MSAIYSYNIKNISLVLFYYFTPKILYLLIKKGLPMFTPEKGLANRITKS